MEFIQDFVLPNLFNIVAVLLSLYLLPGISRLLENQEEKLAASVGVERYNMLIRLALAAVQAAEDQYKREEGYDGEQRFRYAFNFVWEAVASLGFTYTRDEVEAFIRSAYIEYKQYFTFELGVEEPDTVQE